MSENSHNNDAFELWLTSRLEAVEPEGAAFSQAVAEKVEHLKEKEILRRVIIQERLCGAAFVVTLAVGIGLLFCRPVLCMTYDIIHTKLMGLVNFMGDSDGFGLVISLAFAGLCILTQRVWDTASES